MPRPGADPLRQPQQTAEDGSPGIVVLAVSSPACSCARPPPTANNIDYVKFDGERRVARPGRRGVLPYDRTMDMDGKVALITGGSNGIGEEVARFLAGQGAHVVLADLDDSKGAEVADELGGRSSTPT